MRVVVGDWRGGWERELRLFSEFCFSFWKIFHWNQLLHCWMERRKRKFLLQVAFLWLFSQNTETG